MKFFKEDLQKPEVRFVIYRTAALIAAIIGVAFGIEAATVHEWVSVVSALASLGGSAVFSLASANTSSIPVQKQPEQPPAQPAQFRRDLP